MLQHTPLAVTVAPPSEIILPPAATDVEVIEGKSIVVVTEGKVSVVKEITFP